MEHMQDKGMLPEIAAQRAAAEVEPRVLVVEDQPLDRRLLGTYLQKIGVQAECAQDGITARKLAAERSYDMMFVDLRVPAFSGEELIRIVRSGPNRHAAIATVTGCATDEDRKQALKAGTDLFLVKPLPFETFKRAIEDLMRIRAARALQGNPERS